MVGEVDPLGNLTSSPKYDVYGLVRANSGTASSKMGFVGGLGHLSEANTGLIYMKARYYDPQQGRFSSEDPSQNGNNWFIYCDNNPINKVDQTGKDSTWNQDWNNFIGDFVNSLEVIGFGLAIMGIAYGAGLPLLTMVGAAFVAVGLICLAVSMIDLCIDCAEVAKDWFDQPINPPDDNAPDADADYPY